MPKKAESKNLVADAVKDILGMAQTVSAPTDVSEREYGGFRHSEWGYGRDHEEFEADAEIALNPTAFQHGYIHFPGGGARPAEIMVPATSPKSIPSDYDDLDYKDASMMPGKVLNGIDQGLELDLKGNSFGWDKMFKGIVRAVVRQVQTDPANPVPVVKLGSNSYFNKRYSKDISNPTMEIVRWMPMDGE